jgi:DNA-binding PadR family transcriptional regulator
VSVEREGFGPALRVPRALAGKAKWMCGRSAHLRGALLGLVLERPGHGGELANRLVMRFEGTWQIDAHDVYRLLEGLEAEGLVAAREEPRRDKRMGSRVVYHATEETSAALTRWIETLLPREPFRLGLHAKLAVARERDLPGLRSALKQYQRECLSLVQAMCPGDGVPGSWGALFMDCTRDGIARMLQTEIDWAGRTLQRFDEYTNQRAHLEHHYPERRRVQGA